MKQIMYANCDKDGKFTHIYKNPFAVSMCSDDKVVEVIVQVEESNEDNTN